MRDRVPCWERILARVEVYGFEVVDDGRSMIDVKRDGRICGLDLVSTIRISANDPRDVWLLRQAVEDASQCDCVETYFARRPTDRAVVPVELRLGRYMDGIPFLDHDGLDGENERTTIRNIDDLVEALPVLAASNTIGYHRARERIFARYEQLRPMTWADLGIEDAALIAEYEEHYITPDIVARARDAGITAKDAIITAFGMPPLHLG